MAVAAQTRGQPSAGSWAHFFFFRVCLGDFLCSNRTEKRRRREEEPPSLPYSPIRPQTCLKCCCCEYSGTALRTGHPWPSIPIPIPERREMAPKGYPGRPAGLWSGLLASLQPPRGLIRSTSKMFGGLSPWHTCNIRWHQPSLRFLLLLLCGLMLILSTHVPLVCCCCTSTMVNLLLRSPFLLRGKEHRLHTRCAMLCVPLPPLTVMVVVHGSQLAIWRLELVGERGWRRRGRVRRPRLINSAKKASLTAADGEGRRKFCILLTYVFGRAACAKTRGGDGKNTT